MHNHVIITGRLTKAPELRQTAAGVFVCAFTLAVQRKYVKDRERETDFFDVEAWKGTAVFISKNFRKGDLIDISGRLKISRWKDNNNITHSRTIIVAESVDFAPVNNKNKQYWEDAKPVYSPPGNYDKFKEIGEELDLPY